MTTTVDKLIELKLKRFVSVGESATRAMIERLTADPSPAGLLNAIQNRLGNDTPDLYRAWLAAQLIAAIDHYQMRQGCERNIAVIEMTRSFLKEVHASLINNQYGYSSSCQFTNAANGAQRAAASSFYRDMQPVLEEGE